jgi:hypothetical protein
MGKRSQRLLTGPREYVREILAEWISAMSAGLGVVISLIGWFFVPVTGGGVLEMRIQLYSKRMGPV